MNNLVWFRSDLRVDDNPAFSEAVRTSIDGTIAVFFICPNQWRSHDWGAAKVDFALRSLAALSAELQKHGVPLLIDTVPTFAEVPQRLLEIARHHDCDRVLFNLEYEVNERRRDERVTALLSTKSIETTTFEEQTVLPPGTIRTGKGSFFTVFSPFKRAWIRRLEESGIPDLPGPARPGANTSLAQPSEVPKNLEGFSSFKGADLWPAGEAEARRRLKQFTAEKAHEYADTRDLAAKDGTSALSPYLALGVLSIRRCLAAALAANEGHLQSGRTGGIDTWISQLIWRDFYRHVLVGYPRVSMNRAFRIDTERISWRDDPEAFDAWRQGRTGVPFVDAGMRQLLATGWMHNRLRMVTAMFLTKDLLLDWRLGEQHFMRHLVDADLANNNGGWQWSSSTGTDATPYFRIFNPWTQGRRFDPDGSYIRRWVPELADVPPRQLHDPKDSAATLRATFGYPKPIVDHSSARIRALEAFQEEKPPS